MKVVITGVECSGKTSLYEDLVQYFKAEGVSEFSRTFLTELERPYNQQDVLYMAKKQWEMEVIAESENADLIICDTSLLVYKLWSLTKYGSCDDWILETINKQSWDHFLLPHYDIPYEEDPLRESPNSRDKLFVLYLQELENLNVGYSILHGNHQTRVRQAIDVIQSQLSASHD